MSVIAFDTLKFTRTLREKGHFTPEQAEGIADALAEAIQSDLATKSDLLSSAAALSADISSLELRLETKIDAVERRLESKIDSKIAEAKADIIKWVFSMIGFQTLLILGAVIALARVVH